MKTPSRAFSAEVELKCRVFWGPEAKLEFSGMAVSIDSGSMALRFPVDGLPCPEVGEHVGLEVSLPVNFETAGARCLTCRAEVMRVTETGDGLRQLDLHFRKAAFRELGSGARPKASKTLKKAAVQ